MTDDSFVWAWGDYKTVGTLAVFETKDDVGGYECYFCRKKFNKRWDVLKNHLNVCKKKPAEYTKRVWQKTLSR